ncbi:MAG: hypothetical protein K2W96_19835 [Gemmataceae bacterium]|nr:hypothetical protein [Gemmataceae bacterium]
MTTHPYPYAGSRDIAERACSRFLIVRSFGDVWDWTRRTDDAVATFVIDREGWLRLAPRRSEHVACAEGRPVLPAGEIEFNEDGVEWVSNQSTGYCPEPESWPHVAAALTRAGIAAPDGFDPAFHFRRCEGCDEINLLKPGLPDCGTCSAPLPSLWNVSPQG